MPASGVNVHPLGAERRHGARVKPHRGVGGQTESRLTRDRVNPGGRQFGERPHHEESLVGARMRYDEAVIQDAAPVGDEIQIERARGVDLLSRPTEPPLHLVQRVQNLSR